MWCFDLFARYCLVTGNLNSYGERYPSSLIDSLGRVHTNLRISVTDRCNIRCFYCMPDENVRFLPRREILTFEEIERFVRVVAPLGVNKLRLTGGEPLVRPDLPQLVERLAAIDGIRDIALTTNGILLAEQAEALKDAGLTRINISLDTLTEETFRKIARRDGLDRVLAGISRRQASRLRKNPPQRRGHQGNHRAGDRAAGAISPASTAWRCGSSSSCRSTPKTTGSTIRCSAATRSAG